MNRLDSITLIVLIKNIKTWFSLNYTELFFFNFLTIIYETLLIPINTYPCMSTPPPPHTHTMCTVKCMSKFMNRGCVIKLRCNRNTDRPQWVFFSRLGGKDRAIVRYSDWLRRNSVCASWPIASGLTSLIYFLRGSWSTRNTTTEIDY